MKRFTCAHAGPHTDHGGFTRLFAQREAGLPEPFLVALASTMDGGVRMETTPRQERALPAAGYTYLGQFIDHDLSFDPRLFGEAVGADGINLRTPRFDLDSVYGAGPRSEDDGLYEGDRLCLDAESGDFVRDETGVAFVKDERNDANRIVSQLHLAFARFHNRVVDSLPANPERFAAARRIVCQHYQWIVLTDYLPKIVGADVIDQVRCDVAAGVPGALLWTPSESDGIPLEFSAAAFRFGHSMVRSAYVLNVKAGEVLAFDTSRPDAVDAEDLRGFRPLTARDRIAWKLFFPLLDGVKPQLARPIDTRIASPLFHLPNAVAQDTTEPGRNLPYRNLFRGEVDLRLATGQEVVRALRDRGVLDRSLPMPGLEVPLVSAAAQSARNVGNSGIGQAELDARIGAETPLWYFVLKEAEHFHAGAQLGPVGGRIVAEVIVRLLASDPEGMLATGWKPVAGEHGCPGDGTYGIVDLLRYAMS